MKCSFCRKAKNAVGKLISSPSDLPRAYICDECIAVCNSILEDDQCEAAPPPVFSVPVYTSHFSAILKFTRDEAEELRKQLDQALAGSAELPDPPAHAHAVSEGPD